MMIFTKEELKKDPPTVVKLIPQWAVKENEDSLQDKLSVILEKH
jgi:hypothetical protein